MDKYKGNVWNAYFDKSKASPVPNKFPIKIDTISEGLAVEEFDEEVPDDDIVQGDGRYFESPQETGYRPTSTIHVSQHSYSFKTKEEQITAFPTGLIKTGHIETLKEKEVTISNTLQDNVFSDSKPIDERSSKYENEKNVDTEDRLDTASSSVDSGIASASEDVSLNDNSSSPSCTRSTESESSGFESDQSDENQNTSNIKDDNQTDPVTFLDFPVVEEDLLVGEPLTLSDAKDLRKVIFGDSLSRFGERWRTESISFRPKYTAEIQFFKDGPRGLLACLQAYMIKHAVFGTSGGGQRSLSVDNSNEKCLTSSITDMLWKSGDKTRARVALLQNSDHFRGDREYKEDGVAEKVTTFSFSDKTALEKFCQKHIHCFENKAGCILLLYSVILSRTIPKIIEDMGCFPKLLEDQDESSQPLINLLLTGKAVPCCFNGIQENKASRDGQVRFMNGISERNEIGLLSYDEVLQPRKYEVGSRYKTPMYPIWILCTENQYFVVHSKKRHLLNDWKLERRFDLHCTLGVSRHLGVFQQAVRLTVDTVSPYEREEDEDSSVIEDILRTKWCDAVIDWNGAKRI